MSPREPRHSTTNIWRIGTLIRLIASAVAVAALVGPLARSRWHLVLFTIALAVIAADWLWLFAKHRDPAFLVFWAYVMFVIFGFVLKNTGHGPASTPIRAMAVAMVAAGIVWLFLFVRTGRRRKELERFVFSEASSVAFFATVGVALTYGFLEAWLNAPKLPAFAYFGIGIFCYAAASVFIGRRMS